MPTRGTQPVVLFDNKKALSDAGITPPTTWDQLPRDLTALKAKLTRRAVRPDSRAAG